MCEELWVSSWQRQETFSPKQPDWLWVPSSSVGIKCSLPAVKGLGSEADHSSLSSVEAKNEWYFTSSPPCFHSVHRDLSLDIIIQRIMCTEICFSVPQYGVTLQTMLIFLASVLSTSDPMQHLNLLVYLCQHWICVSSKWDTKTNELCSIKKHTCGHCSPHPRNITSSFNSYLFLNLTFPVDIQ